MLSTVSLVFVIVVICGIYYLLKPRKKYNLPPGPWNIPFKSGMFKIGSHPYITFQEWRNTYGPVIRTKVGFFNAVIIDDAKLFREAWNHPAFNGKMEFKPFSVFSNGKHGIVNGEGQEWAEQRRFVLRSLRDFGFGKSSMEEFIQEEIREFLKWMKANEGQPIEVHQRLILATLNFLWTIIAGERHDQEDPYLQSIIDKANSVFKDAAYLVGLITLFPQLLDILPKIFLKQWYTLIENSKPFQKIFSDAIERHVQNPVEEGQPRDFIDVYLAEVKNTKDPNSSFYGERGLEMLQIVIGDLYGAAQGTTPSLLTWSILYLVRFPAIQKKVHKELDAVIGRNRLPQLSDRPNLPYIEAFTLEVHRHSTIAPLGLLHETTEDTTLGGYDIKKGTVVIPNVYSMHYNKKAFEDPEVFRPERFLSADETKVIPHEDMFPFSTGKRQCLGEALGKSTLFLFLASIFQRFEISSDPSKPPPSLDPSPGFFREAGNFTVVLKDRLSV